jgi:hypothetical protein
MPAAGSTASQVPRTSATRSTASFSTVANTMPLGSGRFVNLAAPIARTCSSLGFVDAAVLDSAPVVDSAPAESCAGTLCAATLAEACASAVAASSNPWAAHKWTKRDERLCMVLCLVGVVGSPTRDPCSG